MASKTSILRAFTLLELLIVVVIITAATIVVVPSVGRLVESNNYSSAVNLIGASLSNARSRAIASNSSTGVAFLFDIETETYTLQILDVGEDGATLSYNRSRPSDVRGADIYARAFRPAQGIAPVTLPRGMAVYGLSFATMPSLNGSVTEIDNDTDHWYADERLTGLPDGEEIPWLFPRNDPLLFLPADAFDPTDARDQRQQLWELRNGIAASDAEAAVRHAQSFAVVFDRGGRVVSTFVGGATTPNAYIEFPEGPIDLSVPLADREPVDNRFAFDPETGLGINVPGAQPFDVEPNPEVFVRTAQYLAVVSLPRLREDLGPTISDNPPWFYRSQRGSGNIPQGRMIEDDAIVQEISTWIDNNAEVITFNPYTGLVLKRESQ